MSLDGTGGAGNDVIESTLGADRRKGWLLMPTAGSGDVVPESVGGHVVLRGAQEPLRERTFLTRLPELPGRRFVLLARDAARHSDPRTVYNVLRAVARDTAGAAPDVAEIWFGVEGLAVRPDLLAALARESGLDVLGPSGRLAFAAGSAVFARDDGGERGWWRSSGGRAPVPQGWRFPPRAWEEGLPDGVLAASGATVTPVMAGLVVRGGGTPPVGSGELAFHVVGDQDAVRLVVDDPCPAPEVVARLLAELPGERSPIVVALTSAAADPEWLDALQAAAGWRPLVAPAPSLATSGGEVRTVVLDATRRELFDPFPTTLRLLSGGGQEVVTAAPAPQGWVATGPAEYVRDPPTDDGVRAHVVASGLVLTRRPSPPPPGPERRFDATGWVLEIGEPGEPVDAVLTGAATDLLEGLAPTRRDTVRMLVRGRAEPGLDERLGPQAGPAPATPPPSGSPSPSPSPSVAPSVPLPPSRVPTSTTGPGQVVEQVAPASGDMPTAPEPVAPAAAPVTDERIPDTALRVVDRDSTGAERTRFVAAAGEEFTEALATVNAALATWPGMRRDVQSGAKADLAAVCLYLTGRDGTRSAIVDDAVRRGREGAVDGHLPCLVAGLRRLPVHRRPVLRQGVEEVRTEQGTPGRLLGEPGFLAASTELDVTVAGARYDVLIMPATARRTAELLGAGAVAEAVFPAGSRYRTLGMRSHDEAPTGEEPEPPRVALLLRELSPDEQPNAAEDLDARDRAALSRLERALAGRRRAAVRVVSEPTVVARLTRGMPLVTPDEAAARPRVTRADSAGDPAVAGSVQ